jgi:hypothetical protein
LKKNTIAHGSNIKYKLYILDDIKKIAYAKFGGINGYIAEKEGREYRVERRRAKIAENMQKREDELKDELGKYGLSLRGDSKLCNEYIHNKSNLTVEQIGEIMYEMDVFFKKTDYKKIMKENYFNSELSKILSVRKYIKDGKPIDELPDSILLKYNK